VKRAPAFILLEVMVALLILSVTMTALLRGFTIALHSIRENRIVVQATLLAESLLDDYELEPPGEGREEGSFAEDPRFGEDYAPFYWERDIDTEDPDYDDIPKSTLQENEQIFVMTLSIIYDDGRNRRFIPLRFETFLLEPQVFSDQALMGNQLF